MANESVHASAIVVGVGARQGVGSAVARRFGAEGYHVFAAGRTKARLEETAEEIRSAGGNATSVVTDTTNEADVIRLFDAAESGGPPLEVVCYNAGNNRWGNLVEMEASFFEEVWRVGCLGGFLVGREAARRLAPKGRGSVLFTGATASMRGRPPFTAFASAKAGLRALAQAMAREFGPQGIHVAHFVIDGGIDGELLNKNFPQLKEQRGPDGMLHPDAIADTYWAVHKQHRSAWSHEIDLRPYKEVF